MALAYVDVGNPGWKKYANKNYIRHSFQIELAMDLINYAIKKEWGGESKRTGCMHQKYFSLAIVSNVISALMGSRRVLLIKIRRGILF